MTTTMTGAIIGTTRTFEKAIDNRKHLAERIAAISGQEMVYTRAPRYAYQIGVFSVERDGKLVVTTADGDEGADGNVRRVIAVLKAEGVIGEEIITPTQVSEAAEAQTGQTEINEPTGTETAESVNVADETASKLPNLPAMETTEETEAPVGSLITNDVADTLDAAEAAETSEQPQAAMLETSEECQQITEVPASSPELTASTASTSISEACVDASNSADDNGFSFPLADHTPRSMLNLINLIYTRGSLLSKATGGNFGVDKDLITILADDDEYESKEFLVDFIKEHVEEGARLDGLHFTNTHVTFMGFPTAQTATDRAVTDRGMMTESPEKLEVFKRLAARMNKMAKEQKRIVPKEITEPNEKYALRIWLIRLGMNGADCKADRKILLQNLSGHTAFRTEADKEKWIARQNAKKGKRHVVYEGPTDTTITEPMATNAPNTLTATETATALMATESTITAKEAL